MSRFSKWWRKYFPPAPLCGECGKPMRDKWDHIHCLVAESRQKWHERQARIDADPTLAPKRLTEAPNAD